MVLKSRGSTGELCEEGGKKYKKKEEKRGKKVGEKGTEGRKVWGMWDLRMAP